MNLILSIFLCFALALGGTAGLPAEPETATTWTIRNVYFTDGTQEYTLNPEARITTAFGADSAVMHFEIGNGEKTLLPISAELTNDALTFSLSDSARAYTVTNDALMELSEIDEETIAAFDIGARLLTSYGALLGMAYGSEEDMAAYSEAVLDAVLSACAGEIESVEIELNEQPLNARRAELSLTLDSTFALLDALRDCGVEELENFLDVLLDACNFEEEVPYPNYAAIAEELRDDDTAEFNLPITLTWVEAEDISYARIEASVEQEDASMWLLEEIVQRDMQSDIEMSMNAHAPDMDVVYMVTGQMIGAPTAPEELHLDYLVSATHTESYYGVDDSYSMETEMHMVLDSVNVDGLNSASFNMDFQFIPEDSVSSFHMEGIANDRNEDDGSVTTAVAFALNAEDVEFGASFEINRAEHEYADFFDGAEIYEISEDVFDDGDDGFSETSAALAADVTLLSIDVMQLSTEESVQALVELMQGAMDDYDYDDYDYDYEITSLATLEEAAEIFEGTLPGATPPEGYEIGSIEADGYGIYIEYISEENDFDLTAYIYPMETSSYTLSDGKLTAIDDWTVQISEYDAGIPSSVEVNLPDGTVWEIYFYGSPTLEEVEAILAQLI